MDRRTSDRDVSTEELMARCGKVLGEEVDIEVVHESGEHLKAKFRPVIPKLTVEIEPRWTKPY